ncbi:MAG TPA: hypothetical protein VFY45_27245 [Baekduia sp.]|nr:hypothetical protein [Baekduia sp.]
MLRTWDPATGARLGQRKVAAPIGQMAASSALDGVVLTADQTGAVELWDVNAPDAPTRRTLASNHRGNASPLLVAFTPGGTMALAAWPDGAVERWDVASGTPLSTLKLGLARGRLPWRRGAGPLHLTAAAVPGDDYLVKSLLAVATADGAIARIDLRALRGRTMVPAGQFTDKVTGLATSAYDEPALIATSTAGVFIWRTSDRRLTNGGGGRSSVTFFNDKYVAASADGVRTFSTNDDDQGGSADPVGTPATLATAGPGGIAIGRPDGTVALLGEPTVGIGLQPGDDTSVARFGPQGLLLTVEGYDANHVSSLAAVRPGANDSTTEPHRKVHVYKPDRRWWPQGDGANDHWYVNDATMGTDFVVAAGQDPTGTASVLVWDARTARPLRRLALTTGGIQPSGPSIATSVQVLPDRHVLAAYSAVQESIVLWSTTTWQRIATIAVGPAGGFTASPDGSRLIVAGLSDEQTRLHSGIRTSRLEFIDVEKKMIDHIVTTKDSARVEMAPDGHAIATVDGGRLRVLSPDGRRDLIRPVQLDAELGTEVAWRPDSKVLAVGRSEGGVAIVDPAAGRLVTALPTPDDSLPMALSWSPSGAVLAVTNATENGDSGFKATRPSLWRLDDATLRARMCQLAGRNMTAAEWRRDVSDEIAPQQPCRPARPKVTSAAPATLPDAPLVVFTQRARVLATNADGRAARISDLPQDALSTTGFVWSPEGAVGWVAGGRAYVLRDGAVRSWPCPCNGVVFDGPELAAVPDDGSALLTFAPDAPAARRHAVHGIPHFAARLLALRGTRALVAGYETSPERNSPMTIVALRDGHARATRMLKHGSLSSAPVTSPDAQQVAFRVSPSGGACYPVDRVAVVDVATARTTHPALPADVKDPHSIRSVDWPQAGVLSAVVARPICSLDGRRIRWAPPGQLLRLDAGRFVRALKRDYDMATRDDLTVRITGRVPAATEAGRLVLTNGGGATVRVADGVTSMSVRP